MATPKKKTVSRRRTKDAPEPTVAQYREKKCIRITEADNGFSVSTYGPKGEQIMVAKNEAEAMRHAKALLGGKK
jgi:hypothetical protein